MPRYRFLEGFFGATAQCGAFRSALLPVERTRIAPEGIDGSSRQLSPGLFIEKQSIFGICITVPYCAFFAADNHGGD
jgi:hypothetical protein